MTLDLAGRTHVGLKRPENQDEIYAQVVFEGDRPLACLAVADGMGGHKGGREASQRAIEVVRDAAVRLGGSSNRTTTEQWCSLIEKDAHKAVRDISEPGEISGTTLTLALIHGTECLFGHVGDSRAYLFRNGQLSQVTEDHTWEAYAEKCGIPNTQGKALRQAIGVTGAISPETHRLELEPKDWLLLCSDGLYKMVTDEQIEYELAESKGADDACERLINIALEGGGRDNIAVSVARFGTPPKRRGSFSPLVVFLALALVVLTILLGLALTRKIG